jgi:hypothetical protein
MIKKLLWLIGVLALINVFPAEAAVQKYRPTPESNQRYRDEERAIYTNMKHYGVNRENMAAMRRLRETLPPYSNPYLEIRAKELYRPGEYYRFEMDGDVVNMIVPDVSASVFSRIWPYTDTSNTADLEKYMKERKFSPEAERKTFSVASLSWETCAFIGCQTTGVEIFYKILSPQKQKDYATPEKMLETFTALQKQDILTQAEVEEFNRKQFLDPRMGNQIALKPERVVINGHIWVREAMQQRRQRTLESHGIANGPPEYHYYTLLGPDRMLIVNAGTSDNQHDMTDPSTWSAAVRKGYTLVDQLVKSLRITKINDDGAPDPFVVERIEPAPLPVREPLPAVHP